MTHAPRALGRRPPALAALAAGAAGAFILAASCSLPELAINDKPPCSTVYSGLCGAACTSDAACAPGLYCSSGQCTADCHPTQVPCAQGVCDDHGHCGPAPGTGGQGGSIFAGSGGTGGATTSGGGG